MLEKVIQHDILQKMFTYDKARKTDFSARAHIKSCADFYWPKGRQKKCYQAFLGVFGDPCTQMPVIEGVVGQK